MKDIASFDSAFISKLNEIIFANLENEHFGVNELAREIGLSRFKLNSKIYFIYRKTSNQYIRETRLIRAMEMLQQESVTAAEISFMVGFSSPAYFSTCFSEYYGFPPGEVRKKGLIHLVENKEDLFSVPNSNELGCLKLSSSQKKKLTIKMMTLITFIILSIIVVIIYSDSNILEKVNFFTVNQLTKHKKSIAVLPFINDSKDPDNVYFINGVMEAILDNLSKIEDLDVRPRTSVEQYRNNKTKTISQIARELGVNYIIEGSGQKIGNQVSLYIQLIDVSAEKHIFSHNYNHKLEDIFNLQSEVAIKIASHINAVISIQEKELIEKISTTNIAALNLYLQGNDIHNIAESEKNWQLDIKAERLYKKAIQLDSTYADAYSALGWVVYNRNTDSAFYLAKKALHFDAKNPEAYNLKGCIYRDKGMEKEAEEALKLSIKHKPNNSSAFRNLGELYFYQGKCYNAIENQLKAFHLENNLTQERNNLESISQSLYSLGFYKEGEKYAIKLLEQNNDSSYYYWSFATVDLDRGNYKSALNSAIKMYNCDTENLDNIYLLFYTYLYLRDFKNAKILMQKYMLLIKKQGLKIEPDYLIGFAYFENGQKKEADFHFNGVIKKQLNIIELNQPSTTCSAYLTLAKIYSVRNEKAKSIEMLQKVKEYMNHTVIRIKDYKNCTMFDNIRQEPEFAQYIKETEVKYQREHNKVEKLLRAEGILDVSTKN